MGQHLKVWRICKERHAADAFSGEGARHFSGRWNSRGVPMVYTATSIALAALEVFVHLEPEFMPDPMVVIAAELPVNEAQCERVSLKDLPNNWKGEANPVVEAIGAKWALSGKSLALFVPSAVINGDWNVLLNPLHPDAAKIKIAKPEPFQFDARMFR